MQSIQEIAPTFIPGTREEALNETIKFADAVRNALNDYSLSSAELFNIAQLGAYKGKARRCRGWRAKSAISPTCWQSGIYPKPSAAWAALKGP